MQELHRQNTHVLKLSALTIIFCRAAHDLRKVGKRTTTNRVFYIAHYLVHKTAKLGKQSFS